MLQQKICYENKIWEFCSIKKKILAICTASSQKKKSKRSRNNQLEWKEYALKFFSTTIGFS